ncbi:MAG: hypothetical protein IJF25_06590 [Oscillospiraceae bacterium]|nr:hypothetical protein [Oscillospiraceae bacterium]
MRLILCCCFITLKRGIRAVICAAACLFAVAAVLSAMFASRDFAPARLAVICHDDSGYIEPIVHSVIDSGFKGLLSVDFFDSADDTQNHTAVLTLPENFFESVMSGENVEPQLSVNVSSPIEGAWISALAKNAARLLSSAQHVISAVNQAMIADQIPFEQRQKLIFYTDIELLDNYLTRKGRFESIPLSATGSLSIAEYYAASAVSFVLFTLVFLLFSPIKELFGFAAFSKRRKRCFAAAFLSCFILSLLLTAVGVAVIGGRISAVISLEFFAAALLLCAMMLLFPAISGDSAGCAALSFGFCLIQAIFGGGILPQALLPAPLAKASEFMPLTLMRNLIADSAFGCGFDGALIAALWCVLPLLLCFAFWTRKGDNA